MLRTGTCSHSRNGRKKGENIAAENEKQNKLELARVAYAQPGEAQLKRDFSWLTPVRGEDIPARWNSSDNASKLR